MSTHPEFVLRNHIGEVQDAKFHPTLWKIVSGDNRGEIIVWNLDKRRPESRFEVSSEVLSVSWTGKRRILPFDVSFPKVLISNAFLFKNEEEIFRFEISMTKTQFPFSISQQNIMDFAKHAFSTRKKLQYLVQNKALSNSGMSLPLKKPQNSCQKPILASARLSK